MRVHIMLSRTFTEEDMVRSEGEAFVKQLYGVLIFLVSVHYD